LGNLGREPEPVVEEPVDGGGKVSKIKPARARPAAAIKRPKAKKLWQSRARAMLPVSIEMLALSTKTASQLGQAAQAGRRQASQLHYGGAKGQGAEIRINFG